MGTELAVRGTSFSDSAPESSACLTFPQLVIKSMNEVEQSEGARKAGGLGPQIPSKPQCSGGQAQAQGYLPEAAIHVWVAPAVLGASVSHSILRVGKSLKYISRDLLFVRWTARLPGSTAARSHTCPFASIHEVLQCAHGWGLTVNKAAMD